MTSCRKASRNFEHFVKKVVVVGEQECGKTALIKSLLSKTFLDELEPTVIEDTQLVLHVHKHDEEKVKHVVREPEVGPDEEDLMAKCQMELYLSVHDTSGDEGYDRLRPLSYFGSDLVLLCFAMDEPGDLEAVSDRWMPEISFHLPSTPVILVGTKCDLKEETHDDEPEAPVSPAAVKPQVPDILMEDLNDQLLMAPDVVKTGSNSQDGISKAASIGAADFVEVSSKSGEGVDKLKRSITKVLTKKEEPKGKWKKASRKVSLVYFVGGDEGRRHQQQQQQQQQQQPRTHLNVPPPMYE